MDSLIGKTVGSYRILEQIGEGGMATVYKAYQPALNRNVAVKILPPHMSKEPGFAKRFQREARAVAQLEHRHILPVYDFGQDDDLSYIVMRYVDGGTLKQLMQCPLELHKIADLIEQIAEALDYAHKNGFVHRDVKPSNILIDPEGRILLADFGLARMMEASQQITTTGVGIGTPDYMSPEQGLGEQVDHRTDIYSLGVVLYEMLTGRVPYHAETPMAVVLKHINDPLPLPSSLNPEIPEDVERVVLKAMAKSPEDRYISAGDLARALRDAVRTAIVSAKEPIALNNMEAKETLLEKPKRRFDLGICKTLLMVALPILAIGGVVIGLRHVPIRVQIINGQVEVVNLATPIINVTASPKTEPALSPSPITEPASTPTEPSSVIIPTMTPEMTQIAGMDSPKLGEILLDENFEDNRYHWRLNEDHYLQNGEYHISSNEVDDIVIGTAPIFENFVLEVKTRIVSGPVTEGWGVLFRVSSDLENAYLVRIRGHGEVGLFRTYTEGWDAISPFPLLSSAVNRDNKSNKLAIAVHDNTFEIYVNDTFVGRAYDDALASGTIEVLNEAHMHVAFDYIRVYEFTEETSQTSKSDLELYDDFDDHKYDGSTNPNKWILRSYGTCEVLQRDGSLVATNLESKNDTECNLTLIDYSRVLLEEIEAVEARFRVSENHSTQIIEHNWRLVSSDYKFILCGVNADHRGPGVFFEVGNFSINGPSVYEKPITYDKWYNIRLEIEPESLKFTCLVNGQVVGTIVPNNKEDLKRARFSLIINAWRSNEAFGTTYVDDVRVGLHSNE